MSKTKKIVFPVLLLFALGVLILIFVLFGTSKEYSLTVTAGEGGTVLSDSEVKASVGDVVVLEAEPSFKYLFVEWRSTNGGTFSDSTSMTTEFTMPDCDTEVYAVFEVNNTLYNLTVTTNNYGTIPAGIELSGQYKVGDEIELIVREMPFCYFVEWVSSNGGEFVDSKDSGTTFIMPANDTEICAIFAESDD